MILIEFINSQEPIYAFILGLLSFAILIIIIRLIRFSIDIIVTKINSKKILDTNYTDTNYEESVKLIDKYKKELRNQLSLDPDWIKPMRKKVPKLFKEISLIYYPDHPNPLYAPGISQFNKTIGYLVMDIANLLQNNRIARVFDRSVYNYHKYYKYYKKVDNKVPKKVKKIFGKTYDFGKPVYAFYKLLSTPGLIMLGINNMAVRTILPYIINIIGVRIIELYSGKVLLSRESIELNLEEHIENSINTTEKENPIKIKNKIFNKLKKPNLKKYINSAKHFFSRK